MLRIIHELGQRAGLHVWCHGLRHCGMTVALDESTALDLSLDKVRAFSRHAGSIRCWPTSTIATMTAISDRSPTSSPARYSPDLSGTGASRRAVYHNIPLAPVTGREAIVNTIASFIRPGAPGIEGIEFRVINIAADDAVVMTERGGRLQAP